MTEQYNANLYQLTQLVNSIGDSFDDKRRILDKKFGLYHLINDLVLNFKLLADVNNLRCETQPFVTLARMIVDNYAVLFLLSSHSNKDEQQLRYDLYILDSLNARVKNLQEYFDSKNHKFDERILLNAKELQSRDLIIIGEIKNKIRNSSNFTLITEKDIQNGNWKFVTTFPSKNKFYSWTELYAIGKIPSYYSVVIQNHYSAFVHGLSMTLLYDRRNEGTIKAAFDFLNILLLMISKILINEFPNEVNTKLLTENFKEEMNFFWNSWV